MALVYKIQRSDGLYSTGGSTPRWSKKGKLWPTKQALSAHLGIVDKGAYKADATLITYELVESVVDTRLITEVLAEKALSAAARKAEEAERREKWLKSQRKSLYDQLQKEFGLGPTE